MNKFASLNLFLALGYNSAIKLPPKAIHKQAIKWSFIFLGEPFSPKTFITVITFYERKYYMHFIVLHLKHLLVRSLLFCVQNYFSGCKNYYHKVKYRILHITYICKSSMYMNIDHLKFSFLSHIIMRILKLFPLHYPYLTNLVVELVVAVGIIAMSLIWKISHVTIILTVCLSLNLERWEESYKIFTFHNMMTTYRDV